MTIVLKTKTGQPSQLKTTSKPLKNSKKLFEEWIRSQELKKQSSFKWLDDETIELKGLSSLNLHSFLLKLEELGIKIKYEHKTIITIN